MALLGQTNHLLAATPSGAVTFHSWPLQAAPSGDPTRWLDGQTLHLLACGMERNELAHL